MSYLDYEKLEAIDRAQFQRAKPYPWFNPAGILTEAGYKDLSANVPHISMFEPMFGIKRSYGQRPHDRYVLEYNDKLDLQPCWREFIAELRGERYGRFLRRLFGRGGIQLNFHWHYALQGCSVSPHCDNKRKLGSHIFYFNTAEDWDPAWGGETLILDDGGRFDYRSAPDFESFERIIASETLGNRSLLFQRRGNSWHGVREIRCPQGQYRKIFIVVINDRLRIMVRRARAFLKGEEFRDYY
jgi:hypothetical protein